MPSCLFLHRGYRFTIKRQNPGKRMTIWGEGIAVVWLKSGKTSAPEPLLMGVDTLVQVKKPRRGGEVQKNYPAGPHSRQKKLHGSMGLGTSKVT